MTNERKPNPLQFDGDILRRKGFIQTADGTWKKANDAVGACLGKKHSEPAGALEPKKETGRSGKKRRAKGARRKRPPVVIVSLVCHVPRYFDSDNATIATKAIRDELADWLGVDDGDHRVMWEVDQVLTRGEPGVCVIVREA
jgi:hypothetical protein